MYYLDKAGSDKPVVIDVDAVKVKEEKESEIKDKVSKYFELFKYGQQWVLFDFDSSSGLPS